ncbi:MAG: DUF4124 domain-containing protein [Candidatus Competibacteraceae bacterium]
MKLLTVGVLCASCMTAGAAGLYKWQDDKGVWHYSDSQPSSIVAESAYQRGDYGTAFKEFESWAERGDPSAQYMLGVMYLRGQWVQPNEQTAKEWFQRAAQAAIAKLSYSLALYTPSKPAPRK